MKILAEFNLQMVLKKALLADVECPFVTSPKGSRWKVSNLRVYAVNGCTCANCGLVGNTIIAWKDNGGSDHIDLFHKTRSRLVLMNRDHIIPKSKKGSNTDWNYQTMCEKCNSKKGNRETQNDRNLSKFREHWRKIYISGHDRVWNYLPKFLLNRETRKKINWLRAMYLHRVTHWIASATSPVDLRPVENYKKVI